MRNPATWQDLSTAGGAGVVLVDHDFPFGADRDRSGGVNHVGVLTDGEFHSHVGEGQECAVEASMGLRCGPDFAPRQAERSADGVIERADARA